MFRPLAKSELYQFGAGGCDASTDIVRLCVVHDPVWARGESLHVRIGLLQREERVRAASTVVPYIELNVFGLLDNFLGLPSTALLESCAAYAAPEMRAMSFLTLALESQVQRADDGG